jgi:hypothetical protein
VTDEPRIETGSIVFGSDWPGLFLRCGDAFRYAAHLKVILEAAEKVRVDDAEVKFSAQVLRGLVTALLSVDDGDLTVERQQLRQARECLAGRPTMRGPGPEQGPDCDIEIR